MNEKELTGILKIHLEDPTEPYEVLNTLIQMDKARVHHIVLESAEPDFPPQHVGHYKPSQALFSVNANDVFAWGCADSEFIESNDELHKLGEFIVADPKYGDFRWLCWKRQSQPQPPWIKRLKEENVWDDFFEQLPPNQADRAAHEMLGIPYPDNSSRN